MVLNPIIGCFDFDSSARVSYAGVERAWRDWGKDMLYVERLLRLDDDGEKRWKWDGDDEYRLCGMRRGSFFGG